MTPFERGSSRWLPRRGPAALHRWVSRVDPNSARRIQSKDVKRLIPRPRGVRHHRPATLGAFCCDTIAAGRLRHLSLAVGLRVSSEVVVAPAERTRVDQQFASGLLDEVQGILASGVPAGRLRSGAGLSPGARTPPGPPRRGGNARTIVRENRRYARRQLIWFRKEPNLLWLDAAGEVGALRQSRRSALAARGV